MAIKSAIGEVDTDLNFFGAREAEEALVVQWYRCVSCMFFNACALFVE